jgi:WD40 repeat protein
MLKLPDGVSICIGYTNGDVIILDTQSLQQIQLQSSRDAIQDMAVSSDGHTLVYATNDNVIHIGSRRGDSWLSATWTNLAMRAHKIALTHDGLLISLAIDGTAWMYSLRYKTWLCLIVSTADLIQLVLDHEENTAFLFDIDGHVMSIDIKMARGLIEHQSSNPGGHQ